MLSSLYQQILWHLSGGRKEINVKLKFSYFQFSQTLCSKKIFVLYLSNPITSGSIITSYFAWNQILLLCPFHKLLEFVSLRKSTNRTNPVSRSPLKVFHINFCLLGFREIGTYAFRPGTSWDSLGKWNVKMYANVTVSLTPVLKKTVPSPFSPRYLNGIKIELILHANM